MTLYKKLLPAAFAAACLIGGGQKANAQKLRKLPFMQQEWQQDYQPFRIAGNLYYVGTKDLAAYLITTPDGHFLINTGLAESEALISKHIQQLGFKVKDIKILLTTHAHYDHVAAMAAMKKKTKARFLVNQKDSLLMADGGNSDNIMGGKGPMFLPLKPDGILHDHDHITLGGMDIEALHHPGHTPGATSFLFTVKDEQRSYRVLIANIPSILEETKLTGMPGYPEVGKDYGYTMKAMKEVQFDLWVASHASQFDMEKKHPEGSGYHPEAFADKSAYDALIAEWTATYIKRGGQATL